MGWSLRAWLKRRNPMCLRLLLLVDDKNLENPAAASSISFWLEIIVKIVFMHWYVIANEILLFVYSERFNVC